jgi:hypothetical protein
MRVTLATIKKMTSRLTRAQKLKLAKQLLAESMPSLPPNPSLKDIERRAEEVLSGKVKPLTSAESEARIDRLMSKVKLAHGLRAAQ